MAARLDIIDEAAVAVVGGGIIGCSVAYHLAKAGITDVLVLERGELSGGATARAAGLVCHARSDVSTTKMVNRTRDAIRELETLLEEKLDYQQTGSIRAVFSEERDGELTTMESCLRRAGLDVESIEAREIRKMYPWLDLAGARRISFAPADGYIDGARLGMAFGTAARRLGARVRRGITVTNILTDGTRAAGVETDQGVIRAGSVVLAAGVWGAALSRLVGWGLAAAPTRSHYWITAPDGSGGPGRPNVHLPDMRTYLRSEVGGILIGMQEPRSPTYHPLQLPADMADMQLIEEEHDLDLLVEQGRTLSGVVLSIDDWRFAHHIAGLSNYTPDGKFVIGAVPGIEHLLLAGGCCGSGIAASGGFGQVVADLVAGREPDIDISLYRPDRFGVVDPASEAFRERCAAARSSKSRGKVEA